MERWSALPTWWVRNPGLVDFRAGAESGTTIAALKVVIAIALLADFKTRKASCSLSDLETLTGLSRPMVLRGITALESRAILGVNRSQHVNEYELLCGHDENWGKLPTEKMRAQLSGILNRGAIQTAALKVYMLFVSQRPNHSTMLAISHEKIRNETGIQTRHVRPALDVLINHSLIRLSSEGGALDGQGKWRHNTYTLLGLTVRSSSGG